MQRRAEAGAAAQAVALEDVQRLADGDAARRRRGHPIHVETAVPRVRRRLTVDPVRREVTLGQGTGRCRQVGRGVLRWRLDRARDVAGDGPGVEGARPLRRDQRQRAGQLGVAEGAADLRCVAAGQEQPGGVGEGREPVLVVERLAAERPVDREPPLGELDGRGERLAQRPATVVAQGGLPGGGGAWHADGYAGGDEIGREPVRLAGGRVDECVAGDAGGRGLATVDGADLLALGVVVDEVAAAPDARAVRLRHTERGRGGDRGVGRVATATQHLQTHLRGLRVDGGHGTAGPVGGRRRDRWSRRPRPGVGGCRGGDERAGRESSCGEPGHGADGRSCGHGAASSPEDGPVRARSAPR